MKRHHKNTALAVLVLAVLLAAGCAKFNVPNEDLEKAMPKEPAKEMKDASIKFITANYKLYSCLLEMDQAFNAKGVPADPETTGLLLEYAGEFLRDTEAALGEIADWAEKNPKKIEELTEDADDLENSELRVLAHFTSLADAEFQKRQAAYFAEIRVYLGVARREHEFLKERYEDVVLGLGDAASRYQEHAQELGRARALLNARLQDVSSHFTNIMSIKEKSLSLAADKEKGSSAGILP